jgi:hypothetical protein
VKTTRTGRPDGPNGLYRSSDHPPIIAPVGDYGTHSIEDHLREDWLDAWIVEGLDAVEAYLRNHAAFDSFLDGRE